jgi:hypothetical protein
MVKHAKQVVVNFDKERIVYSETKDFIQLWRVINSVFWMLIYQKFLFSKCFFQNIFGVYLVLKAAIVNDLVSILLNNETFFNWTKFLNFFFDTFFNCNNLFLDIRFYYIYLVFVPIDNTCWLAWFVIDWILLCQFTHFICDLANLVNFVFQKLICFLMISRQ